MIQIKIKQPTPVKIATSTKVIVSDGGYERGYAAGYQVGNAEGYTKGYDEGLAARTYETWTISYTDGTVEEKEVALL